MIVDVDSLLLWDDVLFLKETSTVDVTHPVARPRIGCVDVEKEFLRFHVNDLLDKIETKTSFRLCPTFHHHIGNLFSDGWHETWTNQLTSQMKFGSMSSSTSSAFSPTNGPNFMPILIVSLHQSPIVQEQDEMWESQIISTDDQIAACDGVGTELANLVSCRPLVMLESEFRVVFPCRTGARKTLKSSPLFVWRYMNSEHKENDTLKPYNLAVKYNKSNSMTDAI